MPSECESDAGDSLPLMQRPVVLEYMAARGARVQAQATQGPSSPAENASHEGSGAVYRSLGASSEPVRQYRSLGAAPGSATADAEQDEQSGVLEDAELLARLELLPASLR
jgi:hypothetical protein